MKGKSFARWVAAGTLALAMSPALAEQVQGINLSAGDYLDIHRPFIGIGYLMPISPRWSLDPNAEYVFRNRGNQYSFNVDGRYLMNPSGRNPMHVGAGLGMIHRDFYSNTNTAVNVTWGIDFDSYTGPVTPFIRTKAVFSDYSDLAVSFGIRFGGSRAGSSTRTTAMNSVRAQRASKTGS